MKIVIPTLAILGTLAEANILERLSSMVQRNETVAGLRRGNRKPQNVEQVIDRNLGDAFFVTVNNLDNYGCYCMFSDDTFRLAGGAEPVDEYDEICKFYHEGAVCTVLEDPDCRPLDVVYVTPFAQDSLTTVDIAAECDSANGAGTCEANTCTIENTFLKAFFLILSGGTTTRPDEFQHERGFDVYANCPHTPTNGVPDRACCGEYDGLPVHRYPYRTMDGAMECCADFSVRIAGTCD